MAFKVDKNGDIFLIQGDSGKLTVDGLNTDKNYRVYFAVQDKNRNTVGNEIMVNSNNSPFVVFQLTGEFTNLLKVDKKEGFAVYYYGIKVCDESSMLENTLVIASDDIGSVNTVTVYPKKVEGI